MNGTALDLGKIETQFVERNSGTGMWREIIQSAMYACEEPAACKLCNRRSSRVAP
jgi:hypothetical protein